MGRRQWDAVCRSSDPRVAAMLRNARNRERLTQGQLAYKIGAARSTIGRLETGVRAPSVSMAEALADALDLDEAERALLASVARQGVGRSFPRPLPRGVRSPFIVRR